MRLLYLDHNSTTPMLSEVAEAMTRWQTDHFGNPASQHSIGRQARVALEDAREAIAHLLGANLTGARADRALFTSGGTEANNLALLGLARIHDAAANELIISAIEHPSVVGPAEHLRSQGWVVQRLAVDRDGLADLDRLEGLLARGPKLCAVMFVNNETGVIEPIAEIARRCASFGVALHTDAVQAVGKVAVDFRLLGASTMSVAAHKFHGPSGIGVLLARHDARLDPILFGGFQQQALRPGTESVALAVGMRAALAAWQREGAARGARIGQLRDRFEARLKVELGTHVIVNAGTAVRAPHTSNVAFVGRDRQALVMALDLAGVCCSTGSACASGSSEPSPVLAAMGVSDAVLRGSLRFSLGATTTEDEVDEAVERIVLVVRRTSLAGVP
jgi:cysteine desulfurase